MWPASDADTNWPNVPLARICVGLAIAASLAASSAISRGGVPSSVGLWFAAIPTRMPIFTPDTGGEVCYALLHLDACLNRRVGAVECGYDLVAVYLDDAAFPGVDGAFDPFNASVDGADRFAFAQFVVQPDTPGDAGDENDLKRRMGGHGCHLRVGHRWRDANAGGNGVSSTETAFVILGRIRSIIGTLVLDHSKSIMILP